MNPNQFQEELSAKGIDLSSEQLDQFEIYFETLVEWNSKMNLTSLTEQSDVYLKHFFDSISASFYYDFTKNLSLCDVGAGAGFPSIPLKICFPHIKITIVDSLKKRIGFLEHLSSQLKLENVHFFHDRAETFAQDKDHRETYDLVLARAVAKMSVLSELCLPLVKVGGHFLAMKGTHLPIELEESKKAIKVLGGEVEKLEHFQLPIENSDRYIVISKKINNSPKKYPRKPGLPNQSPL